MKKGLIGAFGLGTLSAMADSLKLAEKVTGKHGADLQSIFYASAFQAGIEQFVMTDIKEYPRPDSAFLDERTIYLPRDQSNANWISVRDAFSRYLPEDWYRNIEYSQVWHFNSFLADLLDAMSNGTSLISPSGIPEIEQVKDLLPSELLIPINNLLNAIDDHQSSGLVVQRLIDTENIERFNEIVRSDLFRGYATSQSLYEDPGVAVSSAVPVVGSSAARILERNRRLLSIRKSGVGVLTVTPKLIDAVFGKLPGALAEIAARLGINVLESKRRVVIYDFEATLKDIVISNLVRIFLPPDRRLNQQSKDDA